MIGGKALVVGAARNCAGGLVASLTRLENLKDSFEDVYYYFITNDSQDSTAEILDHWARDRPNVRISCLDGLVNNVLSRTARLATLRTICLDELKSYEKLQNPMDYFIVADLDGVNARLVEEPVFSSVVKSAPNHWVGLFANQRQEYYDIWALRHDSWCPNDCWKEVSESTKNIWFRRKFKTQSAIKRYIKGRQRHIPHDSAAISVKSAFGGFGIYKACALPSARYVGLNEDGSDVCEHVSFNHDLLEQGGLYILPGLLNDSPREHV